MNNFSKYLGSACAALGICSISSFGQGIDQANMLSAQNGLAAKQNYRPGTGLRWAIGLGSGYGGTLLASSIGGRGRKLINDASDKLAKLDAQNKAGLVVDNALGLQNLPAVDRQAFANILGTVSEQNAGLQDLADEFAKISPNDFADLEARLASLESNASTQNLLDRLKNLRAFADSRSGSNTLAGVFANMGDYKIDEIAAWGRNGVTTRQLEVAQSAFAGLEVQTIQRATLLESIVQTYPTEQRESIRQTLSERLGTVGGPSKNYGALRQQAGEMLDELRHGPKFHPLSPMAEAIHDAMKKELLAAGIEEGQVRSVMMQLHEAAGANRGQAQFEVLETWLKKTVPQQADKISQSIYEATGRVIHELPQEDFGQHLTRELIPFRDPQAIQATMDKFRGLTVEVNQVGKICSEESLKTQTILTDLTTDSAYSTARKGLRVQFLKGRWIQVGGGAVALLAVGGVVYAIFPEIVHGSQAPSNDKAFK